MYLPVFHRDQQLSSGTKTTPQEHLKWRFWVEQTSEEVLSFTEFSVPFVFATETVSVSHSVWFLMEVVGLFLIAVVGVSKTITQRVGSPTCLKVVSVIDNMVIWCLVFLVLFFSLSLSLSSCELMTKEEAVVQNRQKPP